jgi:hypothetical protein
MFHLNQPLRNSYPTAGADAGWSRDQGNTAAALALVRYRMTHYKPADEPIAGVPDLVEKDTLQATLRVIPKSGACAWRVGLQSV